MPLSQKNFDHYKKLFQDDKSAHTNQLMHRNNPAHVISAYQGRFHQGREMNEIGNDSSLGDVKEEAMVENYLFIFANTALPSLFFQNPRMRVTSKTRKFEAAILTAYLNNDFTEKDKEENQLCIIDALLPYGLGVMKNGYNSRTGKVKKSKANIFTGKTSTDGDKTNDMEADVEFIKFEKTIGVRQSPSRVYLDSTQPFGKGNRISFVYDRTLQQIMDSNLYNLSANFIRHFEVKAKDPREFKMTLNEMWIMIGGFAWKLAWAEDWKEELVFIKTKYPSLPRSLLRFNKMGDVLYNISHGKLGLQAQLELNYLNDLAKEHIDNLKNQTAYDDTGLEESGKKTMASNDFGGNIKCNRPPATVFHQLQSASVDPQLFANINNMREYLQLLLSVTGGKGGGPSSKLATVERNKALGDALRSAGLQDSIRDFLIDQAKQRVKNILTLASPEVILILSEKGLVNPRTGANVEPGTEIAIGGAGPALKEFIKGNIDIDFVFTVDMASAQRPDFPVIRSQLLEGATFAKQIQQDINFAGKKIEWDLILVDYFATFDAIPDAQKYVSDMSDEEKAKFIENLQLQAQLNTQGKTKGGQTKKTAPTEDIIAKATENI